MFKMELKNIPPSINITPNEGCYKFKAVQLARANVKREKFIAASELTASSSRENTTKINFFVAKKSARMASRGLDIATKCYQAVK